VGRDDNESVLATTHGARGGSQLVRVGTRLGEGGRYEIRQRIGSGGMAEVYRGVDTRLGNRIVAVKALSARVAEHRFAARMRTLFIQEAQALSLVRHENVVDVLDFGTGADGIPYMVMEFLRGLDLATFLRKQTDLEVARAVDVILGVCAGVHACHLAGIIHRDLKPANVFLARTPKGEVPKVLDFSVAKVPIARATPSLQQSRTDLIVGTPSYMSPEQAVGRPANEESDQYSIGGLLYRCLTGHPPSGLLRRPRELRAALDDRLESVMMRALDPQPEGRFATVHELGRALLPFASPEGLERWRHYDEGAPRVIDPTTTGALAWAAMSGMVTAVAACASAAAGTRVATVAARRDPRAPEPTTRIELHTGDYEIQASPGEPLAEPSRGGVGRNAPGLSRGGEEGDGGPAPVIANADVAPSKVGGSRSSPEVAGPQGFAVVVALVAALAVGVIAAVLHPAPRPASPTAPWPPPWVRTLAPASPSTIGAVGPRSPLLESRPPPSIRSAPPLIHPRRQASPHARRGRGRSPGETIEFGADGLPILR
jgi:serine/threonine-protein kinase